MPANLKGIKLLFNSKITDFQKAATNGGKDVEGVGVIRKEGNQIYRYVYNAHTSALAIGEPVCYDLASNEQNLYEQVIQPTSAALNHLAGLAMSVIPTLGWGWILIEGYFSSCVVSIGKTSVAAGINFYPANTVDYVVGNDQFSLAIMSLANTNVTSFAVSQGGLVPHLLLAESIASSSASAAGSDAGTTNVKGFVHCLTV